MRPFKLSFTFKEVWIISSLREAIWTKQIHVLPIKLWIQGAGGRLFIHWMWGKTLLLSKVNQKRLTVPAKKPSWSQDRCKIYLSDNSYLSPRLLWPIWEQICVLNTQVCDWQIIRLTHGGFAAHSLTNQLRSQQSSLEHSLYRDISTGAIIKRLYP